MAAGHLANMFMLGSFGGGSEVAEILAPVVKRVNATIQWVIGFVLVFMHKVYF